ncbi:MAG TPA: hypothetical protein VG345_13205 [Bryobacteraceae bacterium]|jgi:hypothetical protein|nr:hypothetical protein [Bryobacteraceae bacterium]
MKRLAPILLLAGAMPAIAPAVEWGLPWFHTRPKPVYFDDQKATPVSPKMVKHAAYKNSQTDDQMDKMTRPVWTDTRRSPDVQRHEPGQHTKNTAATAH